MRNLSVEKRVANGIARLSNRNPIWYLKINLETLNVRSCKDCPAAQVYGGDYVAAMVDLGITSKFEAVNGFIARDAEPGSIRLSTDIQREYLELDTVWRQAILKLQVNHPFFSRPAVRWPLKDSMPEIAATELQSRIELAFA